MSYNGAGSLFALGLRLAKLDANGAPLPGAKNGYKTDALVTISLGLNYEDGEEVTLKNGSGNICVYFKAPSTVKSGKIASFQVCDPDPILMEFLIGSSTFESAGNQIGGAAPETGVEANPNGVSIEFWTYQIIDGAKAGFAHWVVPHAKLTLSDDLAASGSDPMTGNFEGESVQDENWGDGPANDWYLPSDRVWQWVQTATMPDLTRGYYTVSNELTVTSLNVLPATAALDVSDGTTQLLNAVATMSDLSTRDVTEVTTWTTSDATKATVNAHGLVSPVAAGTPTITGTYRTASDTVAVTVTA
jgi:hypothetical protein